MSDKTRVPLTIGCILGIALTGLLAPLGAQVEKPDSDLYELSPFIVEADQDIGYLPVSTLAGTRLRTDFRDLGTSIDAMTQEFLDDVGVVTVEESFIYTAHVESMFETGQDSIFGAGYGEMRAGSETRAMGLTSPTFSRNFFSVMLPMDRYNTERIVIARGPQAILFGLGSPSGVVNTNLTRAGYGDDFLEAHSRFDNWGSMRWELDLNQEVISRQLAVRFAAVDDDQRFWLDPCRDKRDRLYGTVTIDPVEWLSIRLHHETLDREGHVPSTQLPRDHVSYLLEARDGKLIDGNTGFWAFRNPYNLVSMILNSEGSNEPEFMSLKGAAMLLPVAQVVGFVSSPSSPFYNPSNPFHDPEWTDIDDTRHSQSLGNDTYYPVFDKYIAGDLNTTIQDGDSSDVFAQIAVFEEIGPFSECFVELAYHRERLRQVQGGMFSGADFALKMDPNRYLPNGDLNPNAGKYYVDSGNNWAEGLLASKEDYRLTASVKLDLNDYSPILGSHQFGLLLSSGKAEQNQQQALRFVGNIGGVINGVKPEAFTGVSMAGPGTNWKNLSFGRRLHTLVYLDEADGVLYPSRDMIPWGGPLDTWYVPTEEGTFGIYGFDPDGPGMWWPADSTRSKINSGSFSWQGWFGIHDLAVLVTTYGYRQDDFDGKLKQSNGPYTNSFGETLTVGEDSMIQETKLYAHWDWLKWQDSWTDLGDCANDIKAAVLQLDPVMDRAFNGGFRAALNYSESTNNTGFSSDRNASGEFHPGQRGAGKNYGIRLEFDQSRYRLSVNKWEVDLIGARAIDVVHLVTHDLGRIESRWRQVEPDYDPVVVAGTGGYINDPNEVLSSRGPGEYGVFADQAAAGWTLDFVANPIPGLRVRANLSRTEAVQSNIGTDWIEWVRNVRRPLWTSEIQWWDDSDGDGEFRPVIAWDPGLSTDANGNDIPDTIEDGDYNMYITLGDPENPEDVANIVSGWDKIPMLWEVGSDLSNGRTIMETYFTQVEAGRLMQAEGFEGLINPDIREWRLNLTGTYTFQDGLLENVSVGGSVRYRDKPFIGTRARFVNIELPDGSSFAVATEDPGNLLFGEDFWFFDAMIGYKDTIILDGKAVGYAIQLNVRNVLDENDPYTTDANSSGRPIRMAQNLPREVYLSAKLEF